MKNKKLISITLLLASTFTMMAGAIIAPSLPQIERVFAEVANISLLTRLVLSIPAIFTALFAPVFGIFADKWGRKNLLIASLLLYAVGGFSGFVLNDIYLILAGRAVLGIAVAGVMTVSSTLIGDYFKGAERNKFLGLQGAFMGFGGVIFISFSGFLADISWNLPFLIYLLSLIVVVTASISLYEPERQSPAKSITNDDSPAKLGATKVYLLIFTGVVFFYMMPVQLPFLLDKLSNMTNTKIGIAISVMNLSSAFVALFYRRIRARLRFESIYLLVLLFMSIGYLIISQSSSYGLILFAGIIAGFGVGLLMPLGNMWIMELAPASRRARLVGNVTTAVYLGQFLSPILLQPFVKSWGVEKVFLFAACTMAIFFVGLFITGLLKKRTRLKCA